MGKLTNTAIGVILATFIVGLLSFSFFTASTDANRREFVTYNQTDTDTSQLLANNNITYHDTNHTNDNFRNIANTMRLQISNAQTQFNNNGNIIDKLAAAFGLLTALILSVFILFLAVIGQAINFFFGVASNLDYLPDEYKLLASLTVLILSAGLVYLVFQLARAYKIGDNI